MEKSSRSKRPPDVNEALSSMLWTPYDQTTNPSSSSDSLTDEEKQRGERKLNRYSNPLPNSLNWWNSHVQSSQPMALRYSFPYYGNHHLPTTNNFATSATTKRTVSTSIDVSGNHGATINTSTFSNAMVHSFTDDFYRYQNQTPLNLSNCQSTQKSHKSQPSLLYDSLVTPSTNEGINRHLEASSASTITTHDDDKVFNQQWNNVRNTPTSNWQMGKIGNVGDLNPYVHEDSSQKAERACTNTSSYMEGKSRKVTQPPNVVQSYSTLSRKCNERRGNKQSEHERNIHSRRETKTFGMVAATKQVSRNRDSSENAAGFYRHDVDDKYRLFHDRSTMRMEPLTEVLVDGSSGSSSLLTTELHNRDLSGNSQMPSTSSSCVYQQHFPVSLTSVVGSSVPASFSDSSRTSSGLIRRHDLGLDYQPRQIEVDNYCEDDNVISCEINVNSLECRVNDDLAVLMSNGIDHEVIDENVKSFQSADKSSTSGPLNCADNLIITSAIENHSIVAETPGKEKFSSDIVTLREKRRRDRRDRRLARTRTTNGASLSSSTNEILPDIHNNHSPPPYADMPPPQQIVPSVVSTVPIEDNRYTFSLPLVRRSTSDRSGKDCCGQWFNGPPLRFLVVLVALGGVACTLGGATLGSIALAGSPTSHLTAGLLMTGVGIVLVTISGVAWRMTTSDAHQCTGRCGRRQCARGNSSFGLLYPEFQHRPPPPSYIESMQEHRLREMMLNRERQASNARASPPPNYRNSHTAGTLLRPPMLFQRQSHITNNVQVDSPIDNSSTSTNSINGNSSSEHQSPTSSQTITTIASINRLSDNEFTLMSTSRETVADVSSLINPSGRADFVSGNESRRDVSDVGHVVMNQISHEHLNCTSSNRSSIRCTSERFSDRSSKCNKESVSVADHGTVNRCKNVNISNTKELNKTLAPIAHLPPASRDSLTRDGNIFGVRRETGVR